MIAAVSQHAKTTIMVEHSTKNKDNELKHAPVGPGEHHPAVLHCHDCCQPLHQCRQGRPHSTKTWPWLRGPSAVTAAHMMQENVSRLTQSTHDTHRVARNTRRVEKRKANLAVPTRCRTIEQSKLGSNDLNDATIALSTDNDHKALSTNPLHANSTNTHDCGCNVPPGADA